MVTRTPNYNFIKPDQTDFYNVDDFNGNTDIIDTELKIISDSSMNHVGNKSNPHNTSSEQVNLLTQYSKSINDPPSSYEKGVTTLLVRPQDGWPSLGNVTTFKAHTDDGGSFQILSPYATSPTNPKFRKGLAVTGGWSDFEDLVTSKLPASVNLVLNAGWTGELGYYKDGFGVVRVNGFLGTGSTPSPTIANLPVGFRPVKNHSSGGNVFAVANGQTGSCRIIIGTDGSIKNALMPGFAADNVILDLSFRTD